MQNIKDSVGEDQPSPGLSKMRPVSQKFGARQNLFPHPSQTRIVRARLLNSKNCWSISRFTIYYSRSVMTVPFIEENDQKLARRYDLEALRQRGGTAVPNR